MKINASPLRRVLSIQRPLFLEKYLIENVEKYISKPSTFQNFLGGDAPRPPPPPLPKKSPPVEITLRRTWINHFSVDNVTGHFRKLVCLITFYLGVWNLVLCKLDNLLRSLSKVDFFNGLFIQLDRLKWSR